MTRFDPTTWIDNHRQAGNARGNVFADILAAARQHRAGNQPETPFFTSRAIAIKDEAQLYDAEVDRHRSAKHAPTYIQWKMAQDQS